MATERSMRVTDPDRIRALAHPVRMDLIQYLDDVGEATATQCAAHLGETVANCSFHLRTLAKAGFIEPAPARGREKPWRMSADDRTMSFERGNPASRLAVTELAGLAMLREVDRVRTFMQQIDEPPPEWADTFSVLQSSFWATAEEMAQLVRDAAALTDRFAGRKDPARRPEGARHGRLFATINPDDFPAADTEQPTPDPEGTDTGEPGPDHDEVTR